MKKLNLEIEINASQEKVWNAIVNESKYRRWACEFHDSSYFEGTWNKGDVIKFLAVSKQGKKVGMLSEIAESNYPYFISIKHLGNIIDGVEDITSDEVKKWAPSYENYTLEKMEENKTKFKLNMDVLEFYYDMFQLLWPRALAKLKTVSEQ